MRIIKEGKMNLPKEVEKTCEHCGCVFAYEKEDVKNGVTLYPDCRKVDYVLCPTCGENIEVENIWR